MSIEKVTGGNSFDDQLLYFTSSSLATDDSLLFFLREEDGCPNVWAKHLDSQRVYRLTDNQRGTLKSYVYFDGNPGVGLGKASISLDSERKKIYYIQDNCICVTDSQGITLVLNSIPEGQVTAFTHVSSDGRFLCVPTTDKRALEGEFPGNRPEYDIDQRIQQEALCSYLRVYDTQTGEQVACERVERAWITHVQFSPRDSHQILYNHEWPSDCGIRRMWLWDGHQHIRLRQEGQGRRRTDWTCHEMWEPDGRHIIYHGIYEYGRAYIGRVRPDGRDLVEIPLPEGYSQYGHFTVANNHPNWLTTDGYYQRDPSDRLGKQGKWISRLVVDWSKRRIHWIPLGRHSSSWDSQDAHPHPIFDHSDSYVYFTSDRSGRRGVYRIGVSSYFMV